MNTNDNKIKITKDGLRYKTEKSFIPSHCHCGEKIKDMGKTYIKIFGLIKKQVFIEINYTCKCGERIKFWG